MAEFTTMTFSLLLHESFSYKQVGNRRLYFNCIETCLSREIYSATPVIYVTRLQAHHLPDVAG